MDHHSRRLVHHRQVLILVQNVERNLLCYSMKRLRMRLALNLDCLATVQLLPGLCGGAIHPHLASLDQQLHPRPAYIGNRLCQISVQPHSSRSSIRRKRPYAIFHLCVFVQIEDRNHRSRFFLDPTLGPVLGPHRLPSTTLAQHVF